MVKRVSKEERFPLIPCCPLSLDMHPSPSRIPILVCVVQKVSRVRSETMDMHMHPAGWVYYHAMLVLTLINVGIVKLGVCTAHWLLGVCAKVGGAWA